MGVQMDREEALRLWRTVTLENVRGREPDLTARQTAVLMTVYLTEQPHTVRGLAETLGVAKPAITRAIDTLSGHGLVKRAKDEADRRNVFIQRTVKGSVFLSDFAERIERAANTAPGPSTAFNKAA